MASNSSTGERRWGSARRGGMTVLGKVAVPKPINLPSQRLENHGLDPNVEIVPKGKLSWGSRPSSSTSNAWGSSVSPNADSSSNSPSRLSARPSSGEGGTRPSTAGSDKVHDSTPNAWSSNSRPSSASGVLTSSQASLASLRPRSAEPRPGSSQLSRFAEPPSDISMTGSRERLVVTSLKHDGFSLSTGDFPSLGSIKSSSGKNVGSQGCLPDHAFHDSGSADTVPLAKMGPESFSVADTSLDTDRKRDDSWRRDSPPYDEDGRIAGNGKWNFGTPPYQSPGILPQHFNAWRGPPVNNPPGGIWFRGPPGGPPPYGGPVPPGGFPMEPFHYYRPQIPASAALSDPQQVLPPGSGPNGPHPRNGDIYRPQMPDAYIRPGIPVRPSFYSGPVPYDSYMGPPVGYRGPNDHDIPIMGMAGGPPSIYGQYPGQNTLDAGNSRIRPLVHNSSDRVRGSEEVESGHHHRDPREPYRVLLKPHDNWTEKNEAQKSEETYRSSVSSKEKADHSRESTFGSDWRMHSRNNGGKDLEVRAVGENASTQAFGRKASGSVVPSKVNPEENLESARDSRDHSRAEEKNSVAPDSPQSVAPADSSLIQKIEGLNAKARASDSRTDVKFVHDRPEKGNKWQVHDATLDLSHPANVQSASSLSSEEKVLEETPVSGTNSFRRYPQGGPGKTHHHHHQGRGRSNPEDADGFRKRPVVMDPILPTPVETFSDGRSQARPASQTMKRQDRGHVPVAFGPGDSQAERVKVNEQRMKQRQEEEQERSREQKLRAQMRMEELNRRKEAVEGSMTQSGVQNKPHESAPPVKSSSVSNMSASSRCTPVSTGDLLPQSDSSSNIIKQQRTAYKQKQDAVSEKNNTQKIADESPKSDVDDAGYDVKTSVDSFSHQKRRSSRGNNRNKPKGDESLPANPVPCPAPNESGGGSTSRVESVKLQGSVAEEDDNVLQTLTEANVVNQPLEQRPRSAHGETQVRGSNQWKSQPSRMPLRNQPVSRATDKLHGGDAAVWTPVQPQNKIETADETSERAAADGQSLSVKSDQTLQNTTNPRNKRGEIERYVPKPVAMEMAQHGSAHQQIAGSASKNKMADEDVLQGDSGSISVAVKETRHVDSRQNRSMRGQGSWRQRGMTDTVNREGLPIKQSQSHSTEMGGNVQKRPEHHEGPETEEKPTEEQPKHRDKGLPCDPSDMRSQSQVRASAARDNEEIPERGKRQPPLKGPKATGNRLAADQKKSSLESVRSQNPYVAPEVSQTDLSAPAPRDNHSVVERPTFLWQRKSQPKNPSIETSKEHDGEASKSAASVNDNIHEEARQSESSKRERRPPEPANEQHEAGFSSRSRNNRNQNTSQFVRGDENRRHNHAPAPHWERQRHNWNYKYQPVGTHNDENKTRNNFEGGSMGDCSSNTGPRYKERGGRTGSRRGVSNFYGQQFGTNA